MKFFITTLILIYCNICSGQIDVFDRDYAIRNIYKSSIDSIQFKFIDKNLEQKSDLIARFKVKVRLLMNHCNSIEWQRNTEVELEKYLTLLNRYDSVLYQSVLAANDKLLYDVDSAIKHELYSTSSMLIDRDILLYTRESVNDRSIEVVALINQKLANDDLLRSWEDSISESQRTLDSLSLQMITIIPIRPKLKSIEKIDLIKFINSNFVKLHHDSKFYCKKDECSNLLLLRTYYKKLRHVENSILLEYYNHDIKKWVLI